MTFVSPTQPFCRCCGTPIRKATTTVYFGQSGPDSPWSGYMPDAAPTSKAEAQRLVNGRVLAVRRYGEHSGKAGRLFSATVWDGESYQDGTFCTIQCAASFGRMAADLYPNLTTQAAFDARQQRKA